MFHSPLGYFHTGFTLIDYRLVHPRYFISKNQGHRCFPIPGNFVQRNTFFGLFHSKQSIALLLQFGNGIQSLREIFPGNGFGGAQCGFIDVAVRRLWRVSTQVDRLNEESIRTTENAANVMHTTHIIQYQNNRELIRCVKIFHGFTFQFLHA